VAWVFFVKMSLNGQCEQFNTIFLVLKGPNSSTNNH